MTRLIIHAGCHKTGTTSVQYCFDANADLLAQHGILYPRIHRNRAHHILALPWQPELHVNTTVSAEYVDEAFRALSADQTRAHDCVFISAENFTRARPNRVDWAALLERFGDYDEIEVIYIAREQISLCQSIYMQVSRDASVPPNLGATIEETLRGFDPAGVSIEHSVAIDMILEGVSASSVSVVSVESLADRPLGVIGYLLERCGLAEAPEGFVVPAPVNISAEPLAHWFAVASRPNLPFDREIATMATRAIADIHGEDARTTLFTSQEIETLRDALIAVNGPANEKLAALGLSYELPGPGLPEGLVTRDRVSGAVWRRLAQLLAAER